MGYEIKKMQGGWNGDYTFVVQLFALPPFHNLVVFIAYLVGNELIFKMDTSCP